MPTAHLTRLVAAAPAEIFDTVRDLDVLGVDRLAPAGLTRGLLDVGDVIVVRRRYGVERLRITVADRPRSLSVRGDRIEGTLRLAATGAGTLLTATLSYRRGVLRRVTALRLLDRLLDRALPQPQPELVVGAAILADSGVLAARRVAPAGWELPGGKVEPGEPPDTALIRECREELSIEVELGDRVGVDIPLGGLARLRVWTAVVESGVPASSEHAELRWLSAADLDSVSWLPADRALLPHLRRALASR